MIEEWLESEMVLGHKRYGPILSYNDGLGRLMGEVNELAQEVWSKKEPAERQARVQAEAMQVAAVALRIIVEVADGQDRGAH